MYQCPKSTVKASMLDLKNTFSSQKVLLFSLCQIGVCLDFVNDSAIGKKSGCATPKENIVKIISTIVDEEHFLVFCGQYSLFGTQMLNWWLLGGQVRVFFGRFVSFKANYIALCLSESQQQSQMTSKMECHEHIFLISNWEVSHVIEPHKEYTRTK